MEYTLTPEQEAWRMRIRDFFVQAVTPQMLRELAEQDRDHSPELYQQFAAAGFTGIGLPEEYGGSGKHLSYMDWTIFKEEAERARAPRGTVIMLNSSLHFAGYGIARIGTPEQKARLLPEIISGRMKVCLGLTGPEGGSDLAGTQMRAEHDGDDYVLTGAKVFNSGDVSTHIFTVCRTDPSAPKHRGLSLIMVDLRSPGISIDPIYTLTGWRRNIVSFDSVRVPAGNLIGAENRGWYQLMEIMDLERSGATDVSGQFTLLERLKDYVKSTTRDGVPLATNPEVRARLADMYRETMIGWLLTYRVVSLQDIQEGSLTDHQVPVAKVFASECAERFASSALDILGADGLLQPAEGAEFGDIIAAIQKMYLEARIYQIAAGPSEVQRNIIATRHLGLPRT
jgi:3-oxocholest-4-en-26-oyl-CoA dehydrogenase alpha subunit